VAGASTAAVAVGVWLDEAGPVVDGFIDGFTD
jgi:hypothetical protein